MISDKPDAQIAVRLCDLRPDGTSAHITSGFLNLTHRNSHESPAPLVPGEEFEISLALDQIAYRVPAGHRLRLAISTASWPTLWPSPQPTELTLVEGAINLPSRNLANNNEWMFEKPAGASGWNAENLRPSSYSRETVRIWIRAWS